MVRDVKLIVKLEREFQKGEVLGTEERFRIFRSMLEYAKGLGVWPPDDPLEGIEKDLKLAEVLRRYGELVKEDSHGPG